MTIYRLFMTKLQLFINFVPVFNVLMLMA